MKRKIFFVQILVALIAISICTANGSKPHTKLGLLILGRSHHIPKLIETGNVAVIKTGEMEYIKLFKKYNPNGIVDFPLVALDFDPSKDDPEQTAKKRWEEYLAPALLKLTPEEKALIDYVEVSPNMKEPHSIEEAQWWNRYADVLCQLVGEAGFKPLIYTIGVGGIPCANEKELPILEAMIPSFRSAHKYGGGWAYHGYTIHYTKDPKEESYYSLRYRRAYDLFRTKAPDLMTMPILLSEGGVDFQGDPQKDGYAYRGSREKYADWLAWYDSELKKDPYVLGVTLFQIGTSGWESFDLEPMTPWLINYYKTGIMRSQAAPSKLGVFVFSEPVMSAPTKQICASKTPILYTGPSEIKSGGIIETYKKSNPNGLVIVRLRAPLPSPEEEPDPKIAARKRWDELVVSFISKLSDEQHNMIDFIDATPGPVKIRTPEQAKYFNNYIDIITQLLCENRFRPIIAAFDKDTIPTSVEDWNLLGPHFFNIWRDKGRCGGAVIYHTAVESYTRDTNVLSSTVLKYKAAYDALLKFAPSMFETPTIVILEHRTSKPPRSSNLRQYSEWLEWLDCHLCADPDTLGILLYKVGRHGTAAWTDLTHLVPWYTQYVNRAFKSP